MEEQHDSIRGHMGLASDGIYSGAVKVRRNAGVRDRRLREEALEATQAIPGGTVSPLARLLHQRPQTVLALIGVISELIYIIYVFLYPLVPNARAPQPFDLEKLSHGRAAAAYTYFVGVLLLFALYLLGMWAVRANRARPSLRLILSLSFLFGFTLIWLYPITATDLFQYVVRARVRVVYGANPLAVTPNYFPNEPYLPFMGEWVDKLSPYGPAWELLAEGIALTGATDIVSGALAYKAVAMAFYLLCIGLVAWLRHGDAEAIYFFAWNPLVLLQGLGNGHNDLVMLAWVLLGIALWERGWWPGAAAALTLATLTKASAALVVPLFLVALVRQQTGWRRRALVLCGAGTLGLALTLLAYLPFWPPWQSLAGVLDEMRHRYTYTIATLSRMLLQSALPGSQAAYETPRLIGQVIFIAFYLWALAQLWRQRLNLPVTAFLAYFSYLLLSASFRIWYPVWLVPLAALCLVPATRWRAFLFCLTAELSLAMFYIVWRWYMPQASWLDVHVLTVPWQYGLPMFLPILLQGSKSFEPVH
jgi:alpha-1,6-mannosyltransferase